MPTKKTLLVTGASSGLGLSLAICALKHGHRVIGTARNPSVAASNYPDFEKQGGKWLKLDVSIPECQQVVEKAMADEEARQGQQQSSSNQPNGAPTPVNWVIINNAGYALQGTIEDVSEADIEAHLQTNTYGVIRVLKAAIPFLRRSRCGTIITMSSILGFMPMPECMVYCAAKSAVEAITESYASLLAPLGIKCVILEPGVFRTKLAAAGTTPEVESVVPEYRERYAQWVGFLEMAKRGEQKGDPDKFAQRVLEIVDDTRMGKGVLEKGTEGGKVLRMLAGKDCWSWWGMRLEQLKEAYPAMEEIANSTDFDET